MRKLNFTEAVDDALAQAMADDQRIIVMGEDIPLLRRRLLVKFGDRRVIGTPISESAFIGAGVAAAMTGLRPVIELYMVDFLGVAMDALINHAAKLRAFTNQRWNAPLVIRVPCGAGYGDGGQHGQSLWGWLSHIPGLIVMVPSTPADAGGLMITALQTEDPVLFLEHKLLSETWLEFLGKGGRKGLQFNVPTEGAKGAVPRKWSPLPLGSAVMRREGSDIVLVGVGVDVHRGIEAAGRLAGEGISAGVLDLRCLVPLDRSALCDAVAATRHLLAIDEDYEPFGLSGELAAVVLESGLNVKFGRVCTRTTIPYNREQESEVLPNVERICIGAKKLLGVSQ
jgi:pyruvate/2-oxoglutarate/acetoin dehydrogenase E1 component